ncbi:hypothetical protein E2562_000786 [Oryza meyeriana var. granulata]|uniref:Uncharacterized protein n=1 Tax=Oryza meyeriana var. granulata TaxID=110450 RepID=A0A6G1DVQ9_9ORYZ|nr:hypothetical protein E2562_000786 [Oryza meyeriana var. granulata]
MCFIQYKVPVGFNHGEGRAWQLQLILIRNFETLAMSASVYMAIRSDRMYLDEREDSTLLDESENDRPSELEDARNGAVEVIRTLLTLGAEPLPPDSCVDKDVAEVLHTP